MHLALELLHAPWRVRQARELPLPEGVPVLLSVAAGDAESVEAAAAASARSREAVRQAASFFIEQVLLVPEADSYRVLGATPAATSGELRRNMAMLMRWLHPDVARHGDQSVFAGRIAAAWNILKTPERRAAYDSELHSARLARDRRLADARRRHRRSGPRPWGLARALAFLLGGPKR